METNTTQVKGSAKDFGHRMFLFGLEIIFYFGIPAVGAVFLAKHLHANYGGTSARFMAPALIVAYIFSWSIVVLRYRMIKRQVKKAREEA